MTLMRKRLRTFTVRKGGECLLRSWWLLIKACRTKCSFKSISAAACERTENTLPPLVGIIFIPFTTSFKYTHVNISTCMLYVTTLFPLWRRFYNHPRRHPSHPLGSKYDDRFFFIWLHTEHSRCSRNKHVCMTRAMTSSGRRRRQCYLFHVLNGLLNNPLK